MKNYLSTLLFIFCLYNSSVGQNNFYISFSNEIHNVVEVIKTKDDGFAFLTMQGLIMKIDSNMQILFCQKLSCDSFFFFHNIIQTTDSGFIINTLNNPFNTNGMGCVVKFDKNGHYIWSKRYYHLTSSSNSSWDMISGANNTFYLLTQGCAGGAVLIKCNDTGSIIWQKGYSFTQSTTKIIKSCEDKFLIFGTNRINESLKNIQILSCDTSGNILWFKEYNNNGINIMVYDAFKKSENEFCVLFNAEAPVYLEHTILCIDSAGNVLSSKKMQNENQNVYTLINSIAPTKDNGILYVGLQTIASTSEERVILIKTDSLNNISWARTFGNANYYNGVFGVQALNKNDETYVVCDNPSSICKLDENGIGFCEINTVALISENTFFNASNKPMMLNNTAFEFENNDFIYNESPVNASLICSNVNSVNNFESSKQTFCYPNPTKDLLTVHADNITKVEIFDIQGKIVKNIHTVNQSTITIDLSQLKHGLYFMAISTERGVFFEKIITL